jgi:hypothetical protein
MFSSASAVTSALYTAIVRIVGTEFPRRQFHAEWGVHSHVAEFNDHPATTWADVEMVLEKVAAGA